MQESKIEWTDATINFWMGCHKVSEGCKFCYMYRDKERYGQNANVVQKVSDKTISLTLKKLTIPSKIFTCSWSDFFIEEADQWRAEAWEIIKKHPQHQWQILTKRPDRILLCLPADWGDGYDNVWIGVSVESQKYMQRIKVLTNIPAKIKFISFEPLLGEIDLSEYKSELKNIQWAIIGGESGNENGNYTYRKCESDWIGNLIIPLQQVGMKVFVKQMGTFISKQERYKNRHGGDIAEWPHNLQVREYPHELKVISSHSAKAEMKRIDSNII